MPCLHLLPNRRASPHIGQYSFTIHIRTGGYVCLCGWLHTKVVCLSEDGHPSQLSSSGSWEIEYTIIDLLCVILQLFAGKADDRGQILAPNQLRTSFELASVMEFGFKCYWTCSACAADDDKYRLLTAVLFIRQVFAIVVSVTDPFCWNAESVSTVKLVFTTRYTGTATTFAHLPQYNYS